MTDKNLSGAYKVDETWHLFVDGDLKEVHVDSLQVQGDRSPYMVTHYDEFDQVITTLTLDKDDLEPVLGNLKRIS